MNGSSWLDHNFDNYQVVEQNASAVVQRGILNFTGAVTVTDNPSNGSTDVAITGAAVPTGTGFWHITSGGSDAAAKLVANADVSGTAAIDVSKLAPGSNGQFLQVVGGVPTWDVPPTGGITQLTGDVTAGPGTGSQAATVAKVNGASVPAAGGLTTGNVLQVSGAAALMYGPINLAGGSNYVTGALPLGNLSPGTAGQILVSNSTPVAAWTSLIQYETTHGRFFSGGSGTDYQAVIGPLVSFETSNAALWLLPNGVAPTSGNCAVYHDAVNLFINSRTSTGTVNVSFAGGQSITKWDGAAQTASYMVPILLDAGSGTFPTTGFIRTKTYSSQPIITNYVAGGDKVIISIAGGGGSLIFGDETIWTPASLRGFTLQYYSATGQHVWLGASAAQTMALNGSVLSFPETGTTAVQRDARTSDAATDVFTVAGQDAYASATGTNQRGGDLALLAGANKSGYTSTFPGVRIGQKGDAFAQTGAVRGSKTFAIWARNHDDSGDYAALRVDNTGTDANVYLGDTASNDHYVALVGAATIVGGGIGNIKLTGDDTIWCGLPLGGMPDTSIIGSNPFRWTHASFSVASGNVTLNASQAANVIIEATGAPGANRDVILPDVADSFYIAINSVGTGPTVTFKKSGGTGVTLNGLKTALIRHNGTDYVLVTTAT